MGQTSAHAVRVWNVWNFLSLPGTQACELRQEPCCTSKVRATTLSDASSRDVGAGLPVLDDTWVLTNRLNRRLESWARIECREG